MNRGTIASLSAYLLWGVLPAFWKLLAHVPAMETLAHRIIWSLVVSVLFLSLGRNWGWLSQALKRPSTLVPLVGSALLVGANWLIFIWAINNGHVVESSLGYFINPLLNVLLGVVFLRERLRPGQWAAIALAAAGVLYLTILVGRPPWIALALALTFGFYGLIRKTAALGAMHGFTVEMVLLTLPMLAYLAALAGRGEIAFGAAGFRISALLMLGGLLTTVPMVLFAYGARRVTLTALGLMQYTAPTLQFLLGAFAFGEGFGIRQAPGFGLIWLALALYSAEGLVYRRYRSRIQPAAPSLREFLP